MWNVISIIFNVILFGISIIFNVILFIWTIYFYLENRKLRGFEIDKNIELKEIEIKELKEWYKKEEKELPEILQSEGRFTSGYKKAKEDELRLKYENKKAILKAKLKYLKKLKKYKWLFS